jgi:hypothetical protein
MAEGVYGPLLKCYNVKKLWIAVSGSVWDVKQRKVGDLKCRRVSGYD